MKDGVIGMLHEEDGISSLEHVQLFVEATVILPFNASTLFD